MNSITDFSALQLPYAYGEAAVSGVIRTEPEDFFVEEELGFEPDGEGEHVFLFIEKMNLNTDQVASQLARVAGVPARQVSYSGMKDRRAVTRQWFSVHLPGKVDRDWQVIASAQLKILAQQRHSKKLRRGVHQANRFVLRVRNLHGDPESIADRVNKIRQSGIPNYFGEQRFGRDGDNLQQAERWFAGGFKPRRHQQGIYLSAARAFLFNALLARRVADGSWLRALDGELLMLAGSHSLFPFDEADKSAIAARIEQLDIHPTGPLCGKAGKLTTQGLAQALESAVFADYATLADGLERMGAKADRRALRVVPQQLEYQLSEDAAELTFSLPRGCFATAVMRELISYRVAT